MISRMRRLLLLASVLVCAESLGASPNLEGILKKVDDIRNPAESYWMLVDVYGSENPSEPATFEVAINGNSKTLITTISPPIDHGKKYLMLDEDIWAFTPNLGRPVRATLSQKLTGQTANGDISRMRWSGDYLPKLERDEPNDWVLYLSAKKKGLTYDNIRAWVDKRTFRPIKAEFLSLKGKVLKNAAYGGFKAIAGKQRPTEIVISDAAVTTDRSTIRIRSMKPRSFPSSTFSQNSLK